MANKKFSLLKSSNSSLVEEDTIIKKKEDYPIIDTEVIEFITKEFPKASIEIANSLTNLKNTLEKSIDFIEDTSSSIIKNERNFNLSGKYREISVRLYDISISIEKYIDWMDSIRNKNEKFDSTTKQEEEEYLPLDESILNNYLEIYNDFTDKTPLSFKLDNFKVQSDDWNDIVIKTADILNKNYKFSRDIMYSNITLPEIISKKSPENEFRDTIIEMLIEYKIDLSKYLILVK